MKYIYTLLVLTFTYGNTYANDLWILWTNSSCVSSNDLRTGQIKLDNIPCLIQSTTNYLLAIAGTISVIFIIIWAYQILFWSLTQNTTKWKDTIISALIWFALAALSWFIIKLVIDNFTNIS